MFTIIPRVLVFEASVMDYHSMVGRERAAKSARLRQPRHTLERENDDSPRKSFNNDLKLIGSMVACVLVDLMGCRKGTQLLMW